MSIDELNKSFGIANELTFVSGKGGWAYAEVSNRFATAKISLYGAHVLNYVPARGRDLLWNTDKCIFEVGKPIRGGVPVCWPWFGPHATEPSYPAHGFARLSIWQVLSSSTTDKGETRLKLGMTDSPETKKLWPYSFSNTITVTVGEAMTIELATSNTGKDQFTYTDALHSYFMVGEISQITIEGLKGSSFYDGTDKNTLKVQEENLLKIQKEENRRHINTSSDCIINDPVLQRKIRVSKTGSNTTVVWNPWIETAKTFIDMGDEHYKTMVCIEAANAVNDIITLLPGQTHMLSASFRTE
jgi:glucose-6-phosphate 1-epimerase